MQQMRRRLYREASGCLFILKEKRRSARHKTKQKKRAEPVTSTSLSTFLLFSTPFCSPSCCHLPRPSNYSNERLRARKRRQSGRRRRRRRRSTFGGVDGREGSTAASCVRLSSSDPRTETNSTGTIWEDLEWPRGGRGSGSHAEATL